MTITILRDGIVKNSRDIAMNYASKTSEQVEFYIMNLQPYYAIQDLSRAFGFDLLQHAAFCRIAILFVLSLCPVLRQRSLSMIAEKNFGQVTNEQENALKRISPPKIFYLGGEGECVKSSVECGLRAFAEKLRVPKSLQLSGRTGAAAAAPGGRAILSAIGYGRRKRRRVSDSCSKFIPRKEATCDQQKQFSSVKVMVIDVISMVGKHLFSNIESEISARRGQPDSRSTTFGSLPLVEFTGDFFQLPPVLDELLY